MSALVLATALVVACVDCEFRQDEIEGLLIDIADVQSQIESKDNQLSTIEGYQAILNRMMAVLLQTPEEDRDAEWQAQYDDIINAMDVAAEEWGEVDNEKTALEAQKWWMEQRVADLEEEIANCDCE